MGVLFVVVVVEEEEEASFTSWVSDTSATGETLAAGADVPCAEADLELRRPVCGAGTVGEPLVGGLLGAGEPCAEEEVGLEPRRPVRLLKGFSPAGPGAGRGNGNGLGIRRSGST